jgi:hypothetical protein
VMSRRVPQIFRCCIQPRLTNASSAATPVIPRRQKWPAVLSNDLVIDLPRLHAGIDPVVLMFHVVGDRLGVFITPADSVALVAFVEMRNALAAPRWARSWREADHSE